MLRPASGQAGIGKTALMAQSCDLAVARGWRVVPTLGVEAEESFALGGLNQLVFGLRDVLTDLAFETSDDGTYCGLTADGDNLGLRGVAARSAARQGRDGGIRWLSRCGARQLGG